MYDDFEEDNDNNRISLYQVLVASGGLLTLTLLTGALGYCFYWLAKQVFGGWG